MAYGPPPSPGQGQQPGWQQQTPWQQPGNLWQQQPQQPQQPQPGGSWQQPQQPQQPQFQQGGGTAQMPGHFGPVSDDEKTWSLMAYVGQFLVGVIAPAVVLVGKGGGSPFVRRHAAQGLNMGLAAVAVWFVFGLLSLVMEALIWVPLLFTAVVMFFLVYAGRAANRGEFRRVPAAVAWPLLKK
ncbi:DUF4870 domain-containing protein [Actinomadura decatromicini]|uniref:DUF4870 domain-containing protein n=1 Tax=Actinomadura decatromicini TaxID=2604572 RepID=A0A5D3FJD4_9ACTN|nr:DUF4870 domain-containing protein [Actinomadura decatromicini]TYK48164.1 DUF4870 domain-containing protein [Actinomadura decatromicini]